MTNGEKKEKRCENEANVFFFSFYRRRHCDIQRTRDILICMDAEKCLSSSSAHSQTFLCLFSLHCKSSPFSQEEKDIKTVAREKGVNPGLI